MLKVIVTVQTTSYPSREIQSEVLVDLPDETLKNNRDDIAIVVADTACQVATVLEEEGKPELLPAIPDALDDF